MTVVDTAPETTEQEVVEEVITETEKVMTTESEMRKAILNGMDPEQAYLKFQKF